eukprot:TRINITY_DN638_c0_g1_i2.p1 TRINITY_DN638_c0_g1~~TRINITY_DN638_c0_g1_i2.p1  ORF type:complete len:496 (-),score=69.62 TRINITY_DN638_c0_g1_i2:1518-3005(-)
MRVLLSECRTIVAEEDRKIRNQARRLQESYGCGGELTGLMIRNFDTLKKLGMVSQNAKVRVLSEMEDDEPASDDDDTLAHISRDPSADAIAESLAKPEAKKPSNQSGEIKAAATKEERPTATNESDTDTDSQKETREEDEDDDDDLDGFGLIKVIPAGNNSVNQALNGEKQEHKIDQNGATGDFDASLLRDDPNKTENNVTSREHELSQAEDRGKGDMHAFDGSSDKIHLPTPRDKDVHMTSGSDKGNKRSVEKSTAEHSTKAYAGPSLQSNSVQKEETQGVLTATKLKSEEKDEENNVMDKFYEAGVGPDGLLMLDRKQSKRVCACCGGYISLVDAESRLLSHYGGKSHHSLALLRAKIPELEATLAKGPRDPHEANSSRYGRYADREYSRSGNHDDWRSRGDRRMGKRGSRYEDRYRDSHTDGSQRYSYRRQNGAEWNSSTSEGYDYRYGSRYSHDDCDTDRSFGRHDRYHGRRKRYRSPSPYRGSRRRRRYY